MKANYIPRLNRDMVEHIVAGCIKATIDAHGPITREWTGSAAKRITNTLLAEISQQIAREKSMRASLQARMETADE